MGRRERSSAEREHALWDVLRDVSDPEWPVSVVDLGLVRSIDIDGGVAHVEMTFTSVGCPFVERICEDVRTRLLGEPGIDDVQVDVTWAPWSSHQMSPAAQEQFARWGVAL